MRSVKGSVRFVVEVEIKSCGEFNPNYKDGREVLEDNAWNELIDMVSPGVKMECVGAKVMDYEEEENG